MNIAVFADVHGRILLAFKLCARWEQETGETIDLILQAGDLGAYPDPTRLDSATIKHARKDSSELGFSEFFVSANEQVSAILSQTSAPMIFVRGNHEDHQWLDGLEEKTTSPIFPIDVYQRIFCLRSGQPYVFRSGNSSISILGVGRVAPLPGEQDITKAKYIQAYEQENIFSTSLESFDLLLTHDTAQDFLTFGYGLEEVRLILDDYQPPYHFHGHTEEPFIERIDTNGITQVIKLTDLHWNTSQPHHPLEESAMGILRWTNPEQHVFEVVKTDWFTEYTASNWHDV